MNKVKKIDLKKYEEFVLHDMDIIDKKTAEFFYSQSCGIKPLATVRGTYQIERYKEEFGISEFHLLNGELVKIICYGEKTINVFVK